MPVSLLKRIREFQANHPYHPTFSEIAEVAMSQFLFTAGYHVRIRGFRKPRLPTWQRNSGIEKGYVYLMKADNGLYKIGKSGNPRRRLDQISQDSPCDVRLVCTIHVNNKSIAERAAHQRYSHRHAHHEWFNLAPADVADFCRLTMRDLLPSALCGSGYRLSYVDTVVRKCGGKEAGRPALCGSAVAK